MGLHSIVDRYGTSWQDKAMRGKRRHAVLPESIPVRFFKVLIGDFNVHLRLPPKFVKSFKEDLPETVVLRGPNRQTWTVGLNMVENTLYFEKGWPSFGQDYSLQPTDFLVFQYVGDSTFVVLMFDLTGCEKKSSTFVKNTGALHSNNRCKGTEKFVEGSLEENQNGVGFSKAKMDEHLKAPIPKVVQRNEAQMAVSDSGDSESSHGQGGSRNEFPSYVDKSLSYNCYFISSRREVTKEEKDGVLREANAVTFTNPGFIQVMKPTNVYKAFRLGIPIEWARKFLPNKFLEVTLRVPGVSKTWIAEYQFRGVGAGLEKGWSRFVMDNTLEDGDVCLFQLSGRGKGTKKTTIIQVSIFRVVKEIVPLRKLYPSRR